jgi:hypothetical protein
VGQAGQDWDGVVVFWNLIIVPENRKLTADGEQLQ